MAHIQRRIRQSKRTGKNTISYQARYTAPDGRERTKRFDRKIDAERWLDAHRADLSIGTWVDPDAGRITLGDFADQWLDGRSGLRSTTTAKYRGLLGAWVRTHNRRGRALTRDPAVDRQELSAWPPTPTLRRSSR